MTLETMTAIGGLAVSILGGLAAGIRKASVLENDVEHVKQDVHRNHADMKQALVDLKQDHRDLKENQDAIIDFLMHRAINAGKKKRLFAENSPMKITDDRVRSLYAPILHDLKAIYRGLYAQYGIHMTDRQLLIAIQKQFGQWITNNVCLKSEPTMDFGECIVLAMILAKEPDVTPGDPKPQAKVG